MGNSHSNAVTIDLDRTNLVYYCGETVSGTVGLNITEGKVEVNEVYIALTGEIGFTKTKIIDTGNGLTVAEDQYQHVPFYSTKAIFAQPEVGQKEIVLDHGKYSWPFEISLTESLPPTINDPHSFPHVRYYLQVIINKPWYKPNTKETKYLTIYPHVNLLQNPQCLQSITFENHNRKDITLNGTLNKSGYVPGESIHITLDIENPRSINILNIDLSILQLYRIEQHLHEYTTFQTTLPNIHHRKDQQIKETFSIKIPSEPLPPSYQFEGGIEDLAVVDIGYMLKLTVKVHGILTNFDVEIPITLGTEPKPDLN